MKSASSRVLLNWAAAGLWLGAAVAAMRRKTPAAVQAVKRRLPIRGKGGAVAPKD